MHVVEVVLAALVCLFVVGAAAASSVEAADVEHPLGKVTAGWILFATFCGVLLSAVVIGRSF